MDMPVDRLAGGAVAAPRPGPAGAARPSEAARRALVLSGGIALGAFEGGAWAALEEDGEALPDWLVGVSAGAVNAALIAGSPPAERVARLRQFWDSVAIDPLPVTSFLYGPPPEAGAWRRAYNRAAVAETMVQGRPGLFRPRLAPGARIGEAPALYDLEPLRTRLAASVDFDRLNRGPIRVTLAATDVESGERVVFDTGRGDRIGPEQVVASCALLPVFAPVEVDGRLLGDGGLAGNTSLDLVLEEPGEGPLACLAIELFARSGSRPRSLAASASRAGDLAFGNQTRRLVEAAVRDARLRDMIQRLGERLPGPVRAEPEVARILAEGARREASLVLIGYHAGRDEAGPGKAFDFSRRTLAERWEAGAAAMRDGLRCLRAPADQGGPMAPGLWVHEVAG